METKHSMEEQLIIKEFEHTRKLYNERSEELFSLEIIWEECDIITINSKIIDKKNLEEYILVKKSELGTIVETYYYYLKRRVEYIEKRTVEPTAEEKGVLDLWADISQRGIDPFNI